MFTRRDRIVRAHVRFRLVVTMSDDKTWDGVLIDADDRTLVLRNAAAVQRDGSRVPADGEVLLARSGVAFVQSVPEMQRP